MMRTGLSRPYRHHMDASSRMRHQRSAAIGTRWSDIIKYRRLEDAGPFTIDRWRRRHYPEKALFRPLIKWAIARRLGRIALESETVGRVDDTIFCDGAAMEHGRNLGGRQSAGRRCCVGRNFYGWVTGWGHTDQRESQATCGIDR